MATRLPGNPADTWRAAVQKPNKKDFRLGDWHKPKVLEGHPAVGSASMTLHQRAKTLSMALMAESDKKKEQLADFQAKRICNMNEKDLNPNI